MVDKVQLRFVCGARFWGCVVGIVDLLRIGLPQGWHHWFKWHPKLVGKCVRAINFDGSGMNYLHILFYFILDFISVFAKTADALGTPLLSVAEGSHFGYSFLFIFHQSIELNTLSRPDTWH